MPPAAAVAFALLRACKLYRYYHMGENTIWKIEKIHSQPKYTANRIHGQDPWIQVGSGMVRISGNLPPHLQSEADLPVHMQGSASSSDEPICALMDSVTSTSSIARVDSPEAMKTVDEGAGQEGVR